MAVAENLALELAKLFFYDFYLHLFPFQTFFTCFKEVGAVTAYQKGHDPPVSTKHSVRRQELA